MCGDKRIKDGRNEDGSMHLSQLSFPAEIIGVLEIIRTILGGQCGVLKQGHFGATDVAEAWFGRAAGLDAASACLALIKAVRQTRRSTFRFSNPACPVCREYVTDHEQTLMRLLLAAGHKHSSAARVAAIMICEGYDETALISTAQDLAIVLGEHSFTPCRTSRQALH